MKLSSFSATRLDSCLLTPSKNRGRLAFFAAGIFTVKAPTMKIRFYDLGLRELQSHQSTPLFGPFF